MKKIYGYIYLIRNTINNKLYFGQTIYEQGFYKRYRNGNIENTHNEHLKHSISKYGANNFEVIEEFDVAYSKDELDKLEDMYIKLYDTTNEYHGYNKRGGGANGFLSIETREKIRQKNLGRKLSEEAKAKISKVHKGRKFSPEHKERISNSLKGKQKSDEMRQNLSKSLKGNPLLMGENNYFYGKQINKKAVVCLNDGQVFETVTEAVQYANLKNCTSIAQCCKGQKHTAGKHPVTGEALQWAYLSDYENNAKEFKQGRPGKRVRNVICVTTGEVFTSIKEAQEHYKIRGIGKCCRGKQKFCGLHPLTGEPLVWMYLEEYNTIKC